MTGLVLDTNAISVVALGAIIYTRALRETAVGGGITLAVPAAGYAAAWAAMRSPWPSTIRPSAHRSA